MQQTNFASQAFHAGNGVSVESHFAGVLLHSDVDTLISTHILCAFSTNTLISTLMVGGVKVYSCLCRITVDSGTGTK